MTWPAGASELDHLVVASHDLEQGVRWCEATLGLTPGPGGEHRWMGTHNRLLKLDAGPHHPRAFLEIIAIAPHLPAPPQPRWFQLDDPALQRRLREQPMLLHWVAGTPRLNALRSALQSAGADPGEAIEASRVTPDGRTLRWRLTVPVDGRLREGGALPTLIEWPPGVHPSATMPPSGLALRALTVRRLKPPVIDALALPGVQIVSDAGPAIAAVLQTPRGEVRLCSPNPLEP